MKKLLTELEKILASAPVKKVPSNIEKILPSEVQKNYPSELRKILLDICTQFLCKFVD